MINQGLLEKIKKNEPITKQDLENDVSGKEYKESISLKELNEEAERNATYCDFYKDLCKKQFKLINLLMKKLED